MGSERGQPVLLQSADNFTEESSAETRRTRNAPSGTGAMIFALTLGAFWIGVSGAYLLGLYKPAGLAAMSLSEIAITVAATIAPPLLFVAIAWAFMRGY